MYLIFIPRHRDRVDDDDDLESPPRVRLPCAGSLAGGNGLYRFWHITHLLTYLVDTIVLTVLFFTSTVEGKRYMNALAPCLKPGLHVVA